MRHVIANAFAQLFVLYLVNLWDTLFYIFIRLRRVHIIEEIVDNVNIITLTSEKQFS